MVELERLTCQIGKVKEYNASFDKLAPAVLPVMGLDQLKRRYISNLRPAALTQFLMPNRKLYGLQQLKS